jgi:hypothetical protein
MIRPFFSPPLTKKNTGTCIHPVASPKGFGLGALLLAGLLCLALPGYGQMNLSGKPGLIYIPTAREIPDGTFTLGYSYNPIRYGLRARNRNPERIIYASLSLLPRLEVSMNLLQLISTPDRRVREALGDRQLDLRYQLMKEGARRPAVALIASSPFTIDAALITYAAVASKQIRLGPSLGAEVSAGLGSPWYVYRAVSNLKNSNAFSGFRLLRKSEDRYKNGYLSGPFGGISVHYRSISGLMAEWDSQQLNLGAFVTVRKHWTVQAGILNLDQFTVGTSYALGLNTLPRRLRTPQVEGQ